MFRSFLSCQGICTLSMNSMTFELIKTRQFHSFLFSITLAFLMFPQRILPSTMPVVRGLFGLGTIVVYKPPKVVLVLKQPATGFTCNLHWPGYSINIAQCIVKWITGLTAAQLSSLTLAVFGPNTYYDYRVFKLNLSQIKRLLGHQKCTFKS